MIMYFLFFHQYSFSGNWWSIQKKESQSIDKPMNATIHYYAPWFTPNTCLHNCDQYSSGLILPISVSILCIFLYEDLLWFRLVYNSVYYLHVWILILPRRIEFPLARYALQISEGKVNLIWAMEWKINFFKEVLHLQNSSLFSIQLNDSPLYEIFDRNQI